MFSKLHLWLSVPVGIFITVICLSGAALVFEQEIKQWLNRDIYASEHSEGQERMRPSEIIAAVKTQALRAALPHTLPVLVGFLVLGASYGFLMQSQGLAFLYTLLSSLFIFAGSMQFVSVGLLLAGF